MYIICNLEGVLGLLQKMQFEPGLAVWLSVRCPYLN
jgi:hypothetical protein